MRTTRTPNHKRDSQLLSRFRTRRDTARGERELALALAGFYGRGVQSDVAAALARQQR